MLQVLIDSTFAGRVTPKVKALTLEEEVRALGLRIVPLDRARVFQQQTVRDWESIDPSFRGSWEVVPHELFHTLETPPPPDVVADIHKASTIPNSKIHAEKFLGDPFVFVTRLEQKVPKYKPYRTRKVEVVCIGYWDAPVSSNRISLGKVDTVNFPFFYLGS